MLLIIFVQIVLKNLKTKFHNSIYHNTRAINVQSYFNVFSKARILLQYYIRKIDYNFKSVKIER